MKKTKRWEIEDRYSRPRKFDRAYANSYEGNRMSMHCLKDRRNWRSSKVWIHSKYLEGLLLKYINKPIEALEEAYNRHVKEIPNAESFKDAYDYIIESLNDRKWRFPFKYIVEDGILKENPEYKSRHYYYRNHLKSWQFKYNSKHIINPGKVRYHYIEEWSKANSSLTIKTPIYLGKLYALVNNKVFYIDVYHYYPRFLEASTLERDEKLWKKKENFEKEWIKVNIGINSLSYIKEIPNRKRELLQQIILSKESSVEEQKTAMRELKWQPYMIKRDYGLGRFLYPVCKIKDIEKV